MRRSPPWMLAEGFTPFSYTWKGDVAFFELGREIPHPDPDDYNDVPLIVPRYRVTFERRGSARSSVVEPHFGLYVDDEEIEPWDVPPGTLTGREAGQVIETVVQVILDYLRRRRSVRAVAINRWGRRSRVRMYTRLAERIRQEMGWRGSQEAAHSIHPTSDKWVVVASTKRAAKKGIDAVLR